MPRKCTMGRIINKDKRMLRPLNIWLQFVVLPTERLVRIALIRTNMCNACRSMLKFEWCKFYLLHSVFFLKHAKYIWSFNVLSVDQFISNVKRLASWTTQISVSGHMNTYLQSFCNSPNWCKLCGAPNFWRPCSHCSCICLTWFSQLS